jgi:hypothetical protein
VLFALSVVKKSDRLRALQAKSTENDEVVEFYEETKPFGALGPEPDLPSWAGASPMGTRPGRPCY